MMRPQKARGLPGSTDAIITAAGCRTVRWRPRCEHQHAKEVGLRCSTVEARHLYVPAKRQPLHPRPNTTHILPGTSGRLTSCRSDTCERHQHGQQQRPPLRQQTWGRVSLKCALRGRRVVEVLDDCRGGPQVPRKPDPPPATNNQASMRGPHVQDERAAIVRASHHNQRGGVVTVVEPFSQT